MEAVPGIQTAGDLSPEAVRRLGKLQTPLLTSSRTFLERLLPPPEEAMQEATFPFIAQYQEVAGENCGGPNFLGSRIPLRNVTMDVDRLQKLLVDCRYPDLQFLDYLR